MSEAACRDSFPLEGYDELVSSLAGGLYSELRRVVELYGEGSVAGLMPLTVSTLEALEGVCVDCRERESEAASAREEKEQLLAQFERERARRKEVEEKFLELEDSIEQDRKSLKSETESALTQFRQMEVKARTYSDMILQLEEEKTALEKQHRKVLQKHNAILRTVADLRLQASRAPCFPTPTIHGVHRAINTEHSTPRIDRLNDATSNEEGSSPEPCTSEEIVAPSTESPSTGVPPEPLPGSLLCPSLPGFDTQSQEGNLTNTSEEIAEILRTTPEIASLNCQEDEPVTSTPVRTKETDCLRNTDSLLQELQTAGSGYIGEVDSGADLSGVGSQTESLVEEVAELREQQAALERARRSLIARVEELVCTRTELREEVRRLVEKNRAQEARISQREAALSRVEREAKETPRSDGSERDRARTLRFTRAEMARVITERNLYKERLFELQEAIRRTQQLRELKEQQERTPAGRSSLWDRFHRLLGISRKQVDGSSDPRNFPESTPNVELTPRLIPNGEDCDGKEDSVREQREWQQEHWRQTRTHIWQCHGQAQVHGWSLPLEDVGECSRSTVPRTKIPHCPALVQVRLLDQREPGNKLSCATSVQLCDSDVRTLRQRLQSDSSNHRLKSAPLPPSSVWTCSVNPSGSDVTVIDPCRSNHVLATFSIPHLRILSAATVPAPPHLEEQPGDSPAARSRPSGDPTSPRGGEDVHGADLDPNALPTVWLGSQSGWLLVHSIVPQRKAVLSVQLADSIHSLVSTQGRVIVTLGNGTLSIFRPDKDGRWDLTAPRLVDLGSPRQCVPCAVSVSGRVWCGYRNRVYVVNPRAGKIEKWFDVSPSAVAQVQHLARVGIGVCASIRKDPCLRIFHSQSGELLQEVDLQPLVDRMFGSAPLGPPALHVTTLLTHHHRLWIGTSLGAIISVPLGADTESGLSPPLSSGTPAGRESALLRKGSPTPPPHHCSVSQAQICFHGHKDAVRFIVAVSGSIRPVVVPGDVLKNPEGASLSSSLVMSGGEGYINFRIGDDGRCSELECGVPKSERSHLIVSQITS